MNNSALGWTTIEQTKQLIGAGIDPDTADMCYINEVSEGRGCVTYSYSEVLPALSEKYGQQIIIISHSPLVLRDRIYKSDRYNFISIDDEYTERCREILFV